MRHEATGNSKTAGVFDLLACTGLLFNILARIPHYSVPVVALCAVLFALGVSAQAEQPKNVHRIGYLDQGDRITGSFRSEAIRLALRELGYVEGQNIAIEYRYAEGDVDRVPELAADLVRLKVDIIVIAGGNPIIRAARNGTKSIPIVMIGRGRDPVKVGLVESLARPGGNVTGITLLNRELGGKRLELLKEAVPKLTLVATIYEPGRAGASELKDLQAAAFALKVTIRPWEVRNADDFERVYAAIGKERSDGFYQVGSPLMFANRKRISGFALKSRLPSMHPTREFVDAGGLMSYGADLADGYRRVAYFVDRILKGAKPADLPVEQSTKFEFSINLKTAKQIGLTIPPNVLARADRVIR
jgi:putative ABC transport system substrate-binding protein